MDQERQISYYNDASHNYLVLECPPELKDNYQYRMLAANQIRGLLDCSGRTIDSKEYLYYDITSRQSLPDLFDRRPVRSADLQMILESLFHVEELLSEYLLDASHLIRDPSCVYMDFRGQACSFIYYPGETRDVSWEPLFTFLADRVDGSDKQAAALIYRLCMMAEKPGFRLRAEILDDLGIPVRRAQAGGSLPADGTDSRTYNGCRERSGNRGNTGQESLAGAFDYNSMAQSSRGCDELSRSLPAVKEPGTGEGGSAFAREPVYKKNPHRYAVENLCPGGVTGGAGSGWCADPSTPEAGGQGAPAGRTPEERNEKSERGTGSVRRKILCILAIAAGIILFGLHFFIRLQEREMLLTCAAGGVLALAGIILLLLQIVPAGSKRDRSFPEAEDQPVYRETYVWEQMDARENISPSLPGETCLLGPGAAVPAGLYGTGSCRGEQIRLTELPCVVGKLRDYVDQVLDDSSVSRMHARFAQDRDGKMTVRDLNSTNGTWLNGERLAPNETRVLRQGDHLRLGRLEFVFR